MKRFISAVTALGVLLCIIATATPVKAADSSSGLSISPRKNLTINPGDTVTDKLQVTNLNRSESLYLSLRVIDFTFTDQSGTPKLLLAKDAPQTTWSLKPFLNISTPEITVKPSESKSVNYTVKIPKNQGAGSYYSAIIYSATGSDGGNVNLNASGVTLAFVSVPGIVNQDLMLKKLGSYQKDAGTTTGGFTFINTKMPEDIGYTLENKGNVAENPTGSITIRRMFSSKTIQIDNINPNGSLALLGQTRLFTTCIKTSEKDVALGGTTTKTKECDNPKLWPGRYTISLDLVYGQNGNLTKEIAGTASFWYIPWWFVATVLGVVVLIVFLVWRIKYKVQAAVKGRPYQKRSRRR